MSENDRYPVNDIAQQLMQLILPMISKYQRGPAALGGPLAIQAFMGLMGMSTSNQQGISYINTADDNFQNMYKNRVGLSSLLSSGSLTEGNSLYGITRGFAGASASDHSGFMQAYRQSLGYAGAVNPLDRIHVEGLDRSVMALPFHGGAPRENGVLPAVNARENVSTFFTRTAKAYAKNKQDFGNATLGDIGQVAAEMVRTSGAEFSGTPKEFSGKVDALERNLKSFTQTTMRLKKVLGGTALHTLSVLNSTFGSSTLNTFKGKTELLDRQTASITHVARLTGTNVSTIMKLGGVSGNLIQQAGGDKFAGMMVGLMAAQYGSTKAGERWVDEGTFRSMQTQRLAGAAASRTSRNISGAYALWRRSKAGSGFATDIEAQEAFDTQLKKAAGGDVTKMGDLKTLMAFTGVTDEQALKDASKLDSARIYRGTDQTGVIIAKTRQMEFTKSERTTAIRDILKAQGVNISDVDLLAYDKGGEQERRKLLAKYGVDNASLQGRIKQSLDDAANARGYINDEHYKTALVADDRAKVIRGNVIKREALRRKLGVYDVSGARGVLDVLDKFAEAGPDAKNLPSFTEFIARAIGVKGTSEELQALGFDAKTLDKLPSALGKIDGYKDIKSTRVKSLFMEMVRTQDAGTLSKKDATALAGYLKTTMSSDSTASEKAEAFAAAAEIGTASGYERSLRSKYKKLGVSSDTSDKRVALISALEDTKEKFKGNMTPEQFKEWTSKHVEGLRKGGVEYAKKEGLFKNENFKNAFSDTATRMGVDMSSQNLLDVVVSIFNLLSNNIPKDKTPKPAADNKPTDDGSGVGH
jgi:hypothetical protein